MENISKENLWKILKGEVTLSEAMKIFGKTDKQIEDAEKDVELNCKNDITYFAAKYMSFSYMCYKKLTDMGEINSEDVYHISSGKLMSQNPKVIEFDMGYQGNKMVRYRHGKWID